jgi:hypothetical protein
MVEKVQFDFTGGVDSLCEQMQRQEQPLSIQKRLHILRLFAKFKRYALARYQVFCKDLGLTVNYIFAGGFNFIIRTARNDAGTVIINTGDVDDEVARILYEAALWVIRFIESSAAYSVYHDARKAGYIIGLGRKT